ncbi:flagellar hook protein FlgE [Nitrosophilus alvini]|uniref:flagellar hook protein FlgE n=1 Tax=Nitrosophilus alvini TaxID=2714855 RepID=UPI00190DF2A9|nr:flagellar hook protein FlgE [Nitrosophilus alvini]
MIQSFYTGNSGLNANKTWLSVISDNIANVNTIGFKGERANFEDLISSSLTTYSNSGVPKNIEIGGGSFVNSTTKDFSQGTFQTTNAPTDLALDGEGFFMLKNEAAELMYYSRNGQFRVDANGDLINQNGLKVQGWALDENGNLDGNMGSLNIPNSMDPKTTGEISFENPTNIDSTATVITAAFDAADSTTYNYVNSMTIYDSLGNPHTLSYYFVHTDAATNQWDVHVLLDNDTTQDFTISLEFDSQGRITSVSDGTNTATYTYDAQGNQTKTGNDPRTSFTLSNGATTPLETNIAFDHMRQLASDFIFYAQQDGNSKGDLMSIAVSEDGVIRATYTNGKVRDLARLAVATFKDKEMLIRKGDSVYLPNQQTFTPIIVPGGVISKIRSGMLEMSNVDISQEFINLITAQRAYQANAKTITTSDQILQTTMDIKR